MDCNLFKSELKEANLDYKTHYYLPIIDKDDLFIEKEAGGEHCVYLLLDLWLKVKNRFWVYDLDYMVRYIGSGSFTESFGKIKTNYYYSHRPTNHKNDLFESLTTQYPGRFKIVIIQDGLTKNESINLEAFIINYALDKQDYYKSKINENNVILEYKQLINKKRERSINKLLSYNILNNNLFYENNFEEVIRRKIYKNKK